MEFLAGLIKILRLPFFTEEKLFRGAFRDLVRMGKTKRMSRRERTKKKVYKRIRK